MTAKFGKRKRLKDKDRIYQFREKIWAKIHYHGEQLHLAELKNDKSKASYHWKRMARFARILNRLEFTRSGKLIPGQRYLS